MSSGNLEFRTGYYVRQVEYDQMVSDINSFNKEKVYEVLQTDFLVGRATTKLGPGSKEHVEVIKGLAECLNLNTNRSKQDLAKTIVEFSSLVLSWDSSCESTGDTITTEGLKRVYISSWCHKNSSSYNPAAIRATSNAPSMQIYKIFKQLSYSIPHAFSEFIDNSIASYQNDVLKQDPNAEALNILIDIKDDLKNDIQTIRVIDDAAGMSPSQIPPALKGGDTKQTRGLNVYGWGMKYALYWFTDAFKITTKSCSSVKSSNVLVEITDDNLNVDPNGPEISDIKNNFNGIFKRETGTCIEIKSGRSIFSDATDDYYRKITKNNLYEIFDEVTEKYENYISAPGYRNLSGLVTKVNIYYRYNDEDITKLAPVVYNPMYKPFWSEKGVEPVAKPGKPLIYEKWVDEFTVTYKNTLIPVKVMMMDKMDQKLATTKLTFHGKGLQYYRFESKRDNRPVFLGEPNRPARIVGQDSSATAKYLRGEIDLTGFGKSMDGTSIKISKSDLELIYGIVGKEFSTKRISTMMKNYQSRKDSSVARASGSSVKITGSTSKTISPAQPKTQFTGIETSLTDFTQGAEFVTSFTSSIGAKIEVEFTPDTDLAEPIDFGGRKDLIDYESYKFMYNYTHPYFTDSLLIDAPEALNVKVAIFSIITLIRNNGSISTSVLYELLDQLRDLEIYGE